ncbi:hypothetical protein MAPG_00247 [Magnaporthiopsis poae ATCC 64411]|uniref:Uncharacterized protein n=1 Tax=Magnaporthiopsis poae (strain ATCC 64411 / 73-15) TaxID=644358 RepID=A0A0C4DKH4_MAGP6|nr:hypothetical protein MAPG_00247 [Magnaporthiopsis poae ATCC 64411]
MGAQQCAIPAAAPLSLSVGVRLPSPVHPRSLPREEGVDNDVVIAPRLDAVDVDCLNENMRVEFAAVPPGAGCNNVSLLAERPVGGRPDRGNLL